MSIYVCSTPMVFWTSLVSLAEAQGLLQRIASLPLANTRFVASRIMLAATLYKYVHIFINAYILAKDCINEQTIYRLMPAATSYTSICHLIYIYTSTYLNTHTYVCVYLCIYVYVFTYVFMYKDTYTHP